MYTRGGRYRTQWGLHIGPQSLSGRKQHLIKKKARQLYHIAYCDMGAFHFYKITGFVFRDC
jgi:hypothetical protein